MDKYIFIRCFFHVCICFCAVKWLLTCVVFCKCECRFALKTSCTNSLTCWKCREILRIKRMGSWLCQLFNARISIFTHLQSTGTVLGAFNIKPVTIFELLCSRDLTCVKM